MLVTIATHVPKKTRFVWTEMSLKSPRKIQFYANRPVYHNKRTSIPQIPNTEKAMMSVYLQDESEITLYRWTKSS